MKKLALATALMALMSAPAMANDMDSTRYQSNDGYTNLQAFERMDLDQNYIVNPVEFDWAQAHYQGLQGFDFDRMDTNGNGIITRDEASVEPYGNMGAEAEVAINQTGQRIERSYNEPSY